MDKLQPGRAPVYEMLEQYRLKGNISYHVPGHKNGEAYRRTVSAESAGYLTEVMRYDVTEITGTDDLHHPEGVIREAQELAADCYGAEESYMLVGGSTAGNLALILTVCAEPGRLLLLQRNVHKSVIHGLMLAGARAVFLEPQIDPGSGLAVAPSAETVQAALNAYPEAAGVMVTMPNYYGMGIDLAPLAQACHTSGVPLLVDEAHGAHYGQHPALPAGALAGGADGVVQSTHKMLTALTMGAMLHVQGPWLDRALLRQRLAMVQSSSPSYPVMASLDLARRLLHSQGASAFTAGLAAVDVLRRGLAALPRFGLLQPASLQQPVCGEAGAAGASTPPLRGAAYVTQDPFKAVIYDAAGVLGGFELQRRLEERGIVPEMSDDRHVVLAFSLGSKAEEAAELLTALQDIAALTSLAEPQTGGTTASSDLDYIAGSDHISDPEPVSGLDLTAGPGQSTYSDTASAPAPQGGESFSSSRNAAQAVSYNSREGDSTFSGDISTWNNFDIPAASAPVAFSTRPVAAGETESIELEASAGRIAAEMVIPYPPGIPLLYPGESITASVCDRLIRLRTGGAKFQACTDPALQHIKVYNIQKGGEA
ncbi:aminotransferase class I/II-fold pyridoxal phosphate-dependent enzyme [Paenibacillus sp. FSL R7-0337]|uniref:aminotransferase class I/II-fold pyridoxal phosphate-dependent enzyme n=1 Tax=Paenibacillus sp. FSL R7-0337 TaxID=1926588 RepID=UPI00096FF7BC|nr:aminotransferase class I/II-fold pyridoxal phosphate-dependent enzyme [Paenibacillus sp. FSL R7-0337]OMF86535.1 amino acid decarboxylase [Paenibacillus sp. FSL R7-0337]